MPITYSDYESDEPSSPPAKRRRTEIDHLKDIKGLLQELLQQVSELRQDVQDIRGRLEDSRAQETASQPALDP